MARYELSLKVQTPTLITWGVKNKRKISTAKYDVPQKPKKII